MEASPGDYPGNIVTASLLRPRPGTNGEPDSVRIEAESFLKRALDALTEHIATLDDRGRIIHVNAAWKRFAEQNNYRAPEYGIGVNYLEVCDKSASYDPERAVRGASTSMLRICASLTPRALSSGRNEVHRWS